MYRSNNGTDPDYERPMWTFGSLLFAILAIITLQGLRSLLYPSDSYHPAAYDEPHSRPFIRQLFQSLNAPQIITALVVLITIALSILTLSFTLQGTSDYRVSIAFVASLALALVSTLLVALVTPNRFFLAFVSFLLCALAAVTHATLPADQQDIVSILLSAALVSTGILELDLATLPGTERDTFRRWGEVATVTALLATFYAFAQMSLAVLFSSLFLLMVLGALIATEKRSPTERVLTAFAFMVTLAGAAIYFARPLTPLVGVIYLSGAAVIFLSSLFQETEWAKAREIPASYLVNEPYPHFFLNTITVLPSKRPFEPDKAKALVEALLSNTSHLGLSIVGRAGEGIVWHVMTWDNPEVLPQLRANLEATSKHTETLLMENAPQHSLPTFRQLLLFGLANDYAAPLPFTDQIATHDPLVFLTQRMMGLQDQYGESIEYQVLVTTASAEGNERARVRLKAGKIRPLANLWQDTKNPIKGFTEKLLTQKLENPLYHAFIALILESRDEKRFAVLRQAARDIEQYYVPGHNRLVLVTQSEVYHVQDAAIAEQPDLPRLLEVWKQKHSALWRNALCVLSPLEIAALWHLPSELNESETIAWAHGQVPEALFNQTDGVPLGQTTTPGVRPKTVYLKPSDRTAHQYIAGMTKTGKSTLMLRLIQSDIAAGHGVGVIDPHSKLIEQIIRTSIPRERQNDVVLLELGQSEYPVPLNPFRLEPGVSYDDAYNIVMFVLQKVYEDIWLDGQTDQYLRNAVRLVLLDKQATPHDLIRVFQDAPYRNALLQQLETARPDDSIASVTVKDFWTSYGKKKAGEQDRIQAPIIHRTGIFRQSDLTSLMLHHPNSLNYQEIISQKKIVLIDVSGKEIAQDVGNLETLLISGFLMGAASLDIHEDDSTSRFYLYVDEIERAGKAPLSNILSESRKYGLALILANQFLDQVPEATLNAVIGNVGITSVFQVGTKDATFLARKFAPELTDHDLINLDLHKIAVKMRHGDKTLPTIVLKTEEPKSIGSGVSIAELRNRGENRLTAANIAKWFRERYRPDTPEMSSDPNPPDSPPNPDSGGLVEDFET